MKRKIPAASIIFAAAATLIFARIIQAQTSVTAIKLFNTGVGTNGTLLAGAAVDPHYALITSADSVLRGPNAYVIPQNDIPAQYFEGNGPKSDWIWPQSGAAATCCGVGSYTYRLQFDLSGLNSKSAEITGVWSSDNQGVSILINGVNIGASNPAQYTAFSPFSVTNGFVSGSNSLDFVVANPGDGEAQNPTSLRVELSGSALPLSQFPTISPQPLSVTTNEGVTVIFAVVATGTAPLAYKWQFDGTNLPGATNTTLSLTNVQTSQAGTYVVTVTNAFGSATSSNATLTVYVPPTITNQPASVNTNQGATVKFQVSATGTFPLAYQWCFNGASLPGATGSALTLANVQPAEDGTYWVIVTNAAGSATSSNALLTVIPTLTVYAPPTITNQPLSVITNQTSSATFSVGATGLPAVSYQWDLSGTPIPGATSPSFTGATNAGYYSVLVSNVAGSVTSSNVSLTFFDQNLYAGITLIGPSGSNFAIQAVPSLDQTNWTTLTNATLNSIPFFYLDLNSPTNPVQFYRAVPLQ